MTRTLIVHRAAPGMSVQDQGRAGYLSFGLSQGGAADRLALDEGAALLGQSANLAALEMAGMGGEFEATQTLRIALTGAPMRASIDGKRAVWNASHLLVKGARLMIGPAETGTYGYLHLGGGLDLPEQLGARSAHLAAGIGSLVQSGDALPVGPDASPHDSGNRLDPVDRFGGGTVHILSSLQTEYFSASEIARFEATEFRRDTRGNRMGIRVLPDGDGFHTEAGLTVLSEVIVPGDVQVTGDGVPYVLLCECQTTGGYPRIGSVLPADLPRVAQTRPGDHLRFRFVSLDNARDLEVHAQKHRDTLRSRVLPLIRNPHEMPDLLSYQLISGMIADDDLEGGDL